MTTSATTSLKESLPIGVPSNTPTGSPSRVVYREFGPPRPLPLPNTSSLSSFLEEIEADHDMATRMVEARKNLATTIYAHEPTSLSALRLAAGFSQAQLATKAQTSQPHIAKIERGQNDPSTDVIARIAQALCIDEIIVYQAIRNQLASRANSK